MICIKKSLKRKNCQDKTFIYFYKLVFLVRCCFGCKLFLKEERKKKAFPFIHLFFKEPNIFEINYTIYICLLN